MHGAPLLHARLGQRAERERLLLTEVVERFELQCHGGRGGLTQRRLWKTTRGQLRASWGTHTLIACARMVSQNAHGRTFVRVRCSSDSSFAIGFALPVVTSTPASARAQKRRRSHRHAAREGPSKGDQRQLIQSKIKAPLIGRCSAARTDAKSTRRDNIRETGHAPQNMLPLI